MAILVVKPNKHFSWWLNYVIATWPTLQHLQSCSVTIKAGICFPSASVIEIEYQTEVSQSLLRWYDTGAKGLTPTSVGKSSPWKKKRKGILDGLKYSEKDTLSCRNTAEGLHLAAPNSNVLTTAGLSACSVSKASSCKCAAELYGWWMTLPDRRPTMVLCPQGACTHTTLRRSSLPPFSNGFLRKPSSYITGFSEPWQPHTRTSMHSPRLTGQRLGAQEVDMTPLCWPMSYWMSDEWGRCHIPATGESGGAPKTPRVSASRQWDTKKQGKQRK